VRFRSRRAGDGESETCSVGVSVAGAVGADHRLEHVEGGARVGRVEADRAAGRCGGEELREAAAEGARPAMSGSSATAPAPVTVRTAGRHGLPPISRSRPRGLNGTRRGVDGDEHVGIQSPSGAGLIRLVHLEVHDSTSFRSIAATLPLARDLAISAWAPSVLPGAPSSHRRARASFARKTQGRAPSRRWVPAYTRLRPLTSAYAASAPTTRATTVRRWALVHSLDR
jgi:hypothetical protein